MRKCPRNAAGGGPNQFSGSMAMKMPEPEKFVEPDPFYNPSVGDYNKELADKCREFDDRFSVEFAFDESSAQTAAFVSLSESQEVVHVAPMSELRGHQSIDDAAGEMFSKAKQNAAEKMIEDISSSASSHNRVGNYIQFQGYHLGLDTRLCEFENGSNAIHLAAEELDSMWVDGRAEIAKDGSLNMRARTVYGKGHGISSAKDAAKILEEASPGYVVEWTDDRRFVAKRKPFANMSFDDYLSQTCVEQGCTSVASNRSGGRNVCPQHTDWSGNVFAMND